MTHKKHFEHKDVWRTPPRVLDCITEVIDLDPCASSESEVDEVSSIGLRNYRYERGENGLKLPWYGTVFVNPPFSEKTKWLARAVEESQTDSIDCIYVLVPDSTDTISWWHKYVSEATYICFFEGRISYIDESGNQGSPPFGSALCMFGEPPTATLDALADEGMVMKSVTDVQQS